MTDISKILTSMLSGGTQPGGAGGLLGQLAGMAGQAGQAGQAASAQGGSLLEQLTRALQGAQGQAGAPAPGAQGGAPGGLAGGLAGLGGLGGLLGGLANAAQSGASNVQSQAGNIFGDLASGLQKAQAEGNLGGFLKEQAERLQANTGGFAGVAGAGTLAGILLGTGAGRQIAGHAARLGGLAAIGGLAYVALRNFQQGKPVVQSTIDDVSAILGLGKAPQGFSDAAGTVDETAAILLRSMVAGAYADGELSPDERAMIVGQLDSLGLGTAEKSYLDGVLAAPLSIRMIAASCTTDEMKAQAYLAAHLGMTVDNPAEDKFLQDFASALGLDPQLVAHLDQAAAEAKAARTAG
ncbi:MAG: tellurite resistance TerB family protein [Rhizobiales bacterium]|nr:tellurite resistance TerB family protein [Hyphomicrobiales bacterium]